MRLRLGRWDSDCTRVSYRRANLYARCCTRDGRLGNTWRACRRTHFHASGRRPGHDRPSGRLGCDCWSGRRRGHHNSRLLPRLGNNPARSRGRWGRRTLTQSTEVRPGLTGRTLARAWISGRWLARGTAGRRNIGPLAGSSRPSNAQGWRDHVRRRGGRHRGRDYRLRWSGGPGRLGRSRRWDRRPLGYRRSFIFSLLDCLEHVARLGDSRPVDLLLGLAFRFGGPGAVLPAPLEVLTYPFCFIAFQRAGVCLLLSHTDGRQGIKNRPALYFELAC